MEEAKAATVANPPPIPKPEEGAAVGSGTQPPAQHPDPKPKNKDEQKPSVGSQTKKRKLGDVDEFRNSTYFKIRSIIKDLRPLFIQVIHAPDFQKCKAAIDIQKQMKTMIELTRQLRSESSSTKPKEELPEEQPSTGPIKEERQENREIPAPQSQNGQNGELPNSSDNAVENAADAKEFATTLEVGSKGTYVIGGSPVGWNFMVYPGSDPIYYGVTKASFRLRQIAN